MADITVTALYASVVEDDEDGLLSIGFAEGEGEDEPYALFQQPLDGGPVWFEVSDDSLGGEDVIEAVARTPGGLVITVADAKLAKTGWAKTIEVKIGPACEDADLALEALRTMLGARFAG